MSVYQPTMQTKLLHSLRGPWKDHRSEERIPLYPPIGRTAITGYMAEGTVEVPLTGSLTTTKEFLLFRDPVWPLWSTINVANLPQAIAVVVYKTDSLMSAGRPAAPVNAFCGDIYSIEQNNTGVPGPAQPGAACSYLLPALATSMWPSMVDPSLDTRPFFWAPPATQVVVSVWTTCSYSGTVSSFSYGANVETWLGPGQVGDFTFSYDDAAGGKARQSGIATWTIYNGSQTVGAWLRLRDVEFTETGTSVAAAGNLFASMTYSTASISQSLSGLGLAPAYGWQAGLPVNRISLFPVLSAFSNNHYVVPQTLVGVIPHSVHLTLENVTKITNKEGQISAASFALSGTFNPFQVTQADHATVIPEKRYFRAAEHGIMTYAEVGHSVAVTRTYTVSWAQSDSSTIRQYPVSVWCDQDRFAHIVVTDADATTMSTFAFRLFVGWEFVTRNIIFPADLSRAYLADLERAVRTLLISNPFRPFERGSVLAVTGSKPERPSRPPQGRRRRRSKAPAARSGGRAPVPKPQPVRQVTTTTTTIKPVPKRKGGLQMYLDSRKSSQK